MTGRAAKAGPGPVLLWPRQPCGVHNLPPCRRQAGSPAFLLAEPQAVPQALLVAELPSVVVRTLLAIGAGAALCPIRRRGGNRASQGGGWTGGWARPSRGGWPCAPLGHRAGLREDSARGRRRAQASLRENPAGPWP